MSVRLILAVALLTSTAASAAPATTSDWVAISNVETTHVLEAQAKFSPEDASSAGLTQYDGLASDLGPNINARYIAAMENRLNVEFPGETQFTGPDAVWYLDLAGTYALSDNVEFKLGVNNVFNKFGPQDPTIFSDSNVDTGTYGAMGRFIYIDVKFKF